MEHNAQTLAAKEAEYAKMLDAITELSSELHTGATPEETALARIKLHQDLHTVRRRKAHDKEVSRQPKLVTEVHPDDFKLLVKYLRQEATPEELVPGGLDLLAINVKECESDTSPEAYHNLLFSLARFYRKAWLENHWGKIDAEVKR